MVWELECCLASARRISRLDGGAQPLISPEEVQRVLFCLFQVLPFNSRYYFPPLAAEWWWGLVLGVADAFTDSFLLLFDSGGACACVGEGLMH